MLSSFGGFGENTLESKKLLPLMNYIRKNRESLNKNNAKLLSLKIADLDVMVFIKNKDLRIKIETLSRKISKKNQIITMIHFVFNIMENNINLILLNKEIQKNMITNLL